MINLITQESCKLGSYLWDSLTFFEFCYLILHLAKANATFSINQNQN